MSATTAQAVRTAPAAQPPTAAARTGLGDAIGSEWIKLWSLRSTWWYLGGAAAIVVLTSLLEPGDGDPTTPNSVAPVLGAVSYFVQYVLAAFGIVAITGEIATRSITVTMACTPRRTRIMIAKALVVGGVVLVTSLLVTGGGLLLTAVRFGELPLLDGAQAETVLAASVYLALLAVFSLGLATLVRRTAGALSVVLLLLLMVPELLRMLSVRIEAPWVNTVGDWTPSPIGWRLMEGQWADGLALLGWAGAAVAAAVWVLRRRDA
ncbi:ABC transporter permease subunit [Promicromonospora panici]|uniref:ABC transporter permease subunit n=1 Tax=Promicromonospora panici TaxID=2219658 RepID=UPI00101D0902|nr:ABC transporter permease subunit [Promicromonospora panici]